MKKFIFVATLAFVVSILSAQELGDIEIVTKKLRSLYLSQYGYVAQYSTSDLYAANLFIPREWFVVSKEEKPIIGFQKIVYLNVDVPFLKMTYVDQTLKYVTLFVPQEYSKLAFPIYTDQLKNEDGTALTQEQLKEKFDEQLAKDNIEIR